MVADGTPQSHALSQVARQQFVAEGGTAHIVEGKADALRIIAAQSPDGVKPAVTLTSRVAMARSDPHRALLGGTSSPNLRAWSFSSGAAFPWRVTSARTAAERCVRTVQTVIPDW